MIRVRIGSSWFVVYTFAHWMFWCDWWVGWKGRRLWAIRWFLRHGVQRTPEPVEMFA